MPFFLILIVGKQLSYMLYRTTLEEIKNNYNTGVEYEIALFYKLILSIKPDEAKLILKEIEKRSDCSKVKSIINYTNVSHINTIIQFRGMTLEDVSFETQNDEVGPADIVMLLNNSNNEEQQIGLSVKYANTCTLNVTGRNFLTEKQVETLRKLLPQYTERYVQEMCNVYGDVSKWFRERKQSKTTDEYIDKIRDSVIENWPFVKDKDILLSALFHSDSPIEYWVITYGNSKYSINTKPQTIERQRADDVTIEKMDTSYIAFYLDGKRIGHMQVKFNNGFVERCKKKTPDYICQGIKMTFGKPFSSWNFSVEK